VLGGVVAQPNARGALSLRRPCGWSICWSASARDASAGSTCCRVYSRWSTSSVETPDMTIDMANIRSFTRYGADFATPELAYHALLTETGAPCDYSRPGVRMPLPDSSVWRDAVLGIGHAIGIETRDTTCGRRRSCRLSKHVNPSARQVARQGRSDGSGRGQRSEGALRRRPTHRTVRIVQSRPDPWRST
jgi:hypothetical protein